MLSFLAAVPRIIRYFSRQPDVVASRRKGEEDLASCRATTRNNNRLIIMINDTMNTLDTVYTLNAFTRMRRISKGKSIPPRRTRRAFDHVSIIRFADERKMAARRARDSSRPAQCPHTSNARGIRARIVHTYIYIYIHAYIHISSIEEIYIVYVSTYTITGSPSIIFRSVATNDDERLVVVVARRVSRRGETYGQT